MKASEGGGKFGRYPDQLQEEGTTCAEAIDAAENARAGRGVTRYTSEMVKPTPRYDRQGGPLECIFRHFSHQKCER